MVIDTAVILAGGKGTRLSEKTREMPKPMLPIAGKPILQHIIDIYRSQGVNNFIIPVGHLSFQVFEYFAAVQQSFGFVGIDGCVALFRSTDFGVALVDSGKETLTGGRLRACADLLPEKFHFTYGDGLSNVNLQHLEWAHLGAPSYTLGTITAVHPVPRFGAMRISHDGVVTSFGEKKDNQGWINGGWSILDRRILDYIPDQNCNLESDVYPVLAEDGLLRASYHTGYWHCIDTLRDLEQAEQHYAEVGAWK